jgi:hypothetical protein
VRVCPDKSKFDYFLKNDILTILNNSDLLKVRKEIENNKKVAELNEVNKQNIHLFLQSHSHFGMSPGLIRELFTVPISTFNLYKFYV